MTEKQDLPSQLTRFLEENHIGRAELSCLVADLIADPSERVLASRAFDALDAGSEPTTAGLQALTNVLQDAMGFEVDVSRIDRLDRKVLGVVAQGVGGVLCLSALYIVLGGVAAGEATLTALYDAPVALTYVLLVLALLLLASLEGTQIAIVALTDKKVSAFRAAYPRGVEVARLVQSREAVQRYLAGRQFFVIFVVFVIAQVTSFPTMSTFPFTDLSIDSAPSIITLLGFRLGLFGALFVLWLGQLVPQFIANKDPLYFLNLPGMKAVIQLCMALESVGPTRPADWLSGLVRRELSVPTARVVKHRELVQDVFGYEVIAQRYCWHLHSPRQWDFEYTNVYGIQADGITRLSERALRFFGQLEQAQFTNALVNGDEQRSALVGSLGVEAARDADGWTQFAQRITSEDAFRAGDVVQSTYTLSGSGRADRGYLMVTKPTKSVSFMVRLDPALIDCPGLTVSTYQYDDLTEQARHVDTRHIEPTLDGAQRILSFTDLFPRLNTYYELSWGTVSAEAVESPTAISIT